MPTLVAMEASTAPATPAWLTLAVALLILAGTLWTGLSTRAAAKSSVRAAEQAGTATVNAAAAAASAAKSSAELNTATTRFVSRSDRYAKWQMYKRQIYAELIQAIREAHREPGDAMRLESRSRKFDAAYLAAKRALRTRLGEIASHGWFSGEDFGELERSIQQLLEAMAMDVQPRRKTKAAAGGLSGTGASSS